MASQLRLLKLYLGPNTQRPHACVSPARKNDEELCLHPPSSLRVGEREIFWELEGTSSLQHAERGLSRPRSQESPAFRVPGVLMVSPEKGLLCTTCHHASFMPGPRPACSTGCQEFTPISLQVPHFIIPCCPVCITGGLLQGVVHSFCGRRN